MIERLVTSYKDVYMSFPLSLPKEMCGSVAQHNFNQPIKCAPPYTPLFLSLIKLYDDAARNFFTLNDLQLWQL